MRIRQPRGIRKKECSKCGEPIEENRLATKQRYCKKCHAANMRINRPKHTELTETQRKKANARAYAKEYLKRGKLNKGKCEICGSEAQMHHDDYDKPLQVRWLCRKHHLEHHKQIECGNLILTE